MKPLRGAFRFKHETSERLHDTRSNLSSVAEFFESVSEALSEKQAATVLQAVERTLPWAGLVVDAVGETLPPVKLLVRLFEELADEPDPHALGYLACTLAYQRSVEQAVQATAPSISPSAPVIRLALPHRPNEEYQFFSFSLSNAHEHVFFKDAQACLDAFAQGLGFRPDDSRNIKLQREVRARFVPNLMGVLSHGKTCKRFEAFSRMLALGTPGLSVEEAALHHAETQRWLYEEYPVLGNESFSLAEVYVDPNCTQVAWDQIYRCRQDPFSSGLQARPLLESAMATVTDSDYRGALVVQGPAGAGKSSFSLQLCAKLVEAGLTPLRIELRHLDARAGTPLCEALARALEVQSPVRNPTAERFLPQGGRYNDAFMALFDQQVTFGGASLCPYVLILDGLDELPLSGGSNYLERLREVLRDVQETFLRRRTGSLVRVLLIGRPSPLLAQARFLTEGTRILSLLPWTGDHLDRFVGTVTSLQNLSRDLGIAPRWRMPHESVCAQLLARFRAGDQLAMLGSPLLAHLCFRLLGETAQGQPAEILVELMQDPTSLYRHMVDLVITKSGKAPNAEFNPESSYMISGDPLRDVLQRTAEAMSVLAAENIAYGELMLRLDTDQRRFESQIVALEGEELISRLMISFFFKGGHEALGCEFAHKSFREYLFAERVVEILKRYGRATHERSVALRRSEEYWRDFDEDDPRYSLSRDLTNALGPTWLVPEVANYIVSLIRWEIVRVIDERNDVQQHAGWAQGKAGCSLAAWCRVRNGLADLWEWWGEGVHLRPQPRRKRGERGYDWGEPLSLKAAREARFRDTFELRPGPIRQISIDAHLGDALFALGACVHSSLLDVPSPVVGNYQHVDGAKTRFAPSGPDGAYFTFYAHRINAAGYRPQGEFPNGASLDEVHLPGGSTLHD